MANVEYERALEALKSLSAREDDEKHRGAIERVDKARVKQEEIRGRIRASSPRLADLKYPEPMSSSAASELLDKGDLLIAWSLGKKKSFLFTLGQAEDSFDAYNLDLTESSIRTDVSGFK